MRSALRLLGSRLPKTEGTLKTGVRSKVTIRRDSWGVPYIEAKNSLDAFFAHGFVMGQDRAFQLDLYLRLGRGTLAEIVGKDGLHPDQIARRLGFERTAKAQFALFDEQTKAEHTAFAAGVNAGIESGSKPHELALMGSRPLRFEPSDPLCILQFICFALSTNWDAELARLRVLQSDGPEALLALEYADPAHLALDSAALGRLASDVELLKAAEQFTADAAEATSVANINAASNNWALTAAKTSTGRPLFVADPHLGPTIPAPWYLLHLRCPEWSMAGASFPGQPTITFGHTDRLAWSVTTGHADTTDLFVEKLGPDGTTALRGDRWVPCEVRDEVIKVKGGKDVVERVVTTPAGPIVTPRMAAGGTALSLRATWMAARPIRAYGAHRVSDLSSLRGLFEGYPCGTENRLFGDVDGNITWQLTGDVPVRKKGHGLLPMPAWDVDAGWEDEPLPFSKMPTRSNPPEGFLATANAAPPETAAYLGADWLDGARHRRIHELLTTRNDWDLDSAAAMQLDRTNIYWKALQKPLLAAIEPAPEGAERSAALLKLWDGVVATESAAAAVYELLFSELACRVIRVKAPRAWEHAAGAGLNDVLEHGMSSIRRSSHTVRLICEQPDGWFARGWRDEIRSALVSVEQQLIAAGGEDPSQWAWGRLRPLTLMHPTGKIPVLKNMFNVGPIPFGGDSSTLPQASVPFDHPLGNPIGIPNLRMILDMGNWDASRFVIAGGQSGNPLSPHYDDMIPLWERGQTITMPWAPEAIVAATKQVLTLEP
jgi:penicillin G amidase